MCWFALLFKFPFTSDKFISLLWKIQHAYNTFIQHADTTRTTGSNTTQSLYNMFIQHADKTWESKN